MRWRDLRHDLSQEIQQPAAYANLVAASIHYRVGLCLVARERGRFAMHNGVPDSSGTGGEFRLTGTVFFGLLSPFPARSHSAYQVTSPLPERAFASRASVKSRSESRFR